MSKPALAELLNIFVEYVRPIISEDQAPVHSFQIDRERSECKLTFPATTEDGFDVTLTVDHLGLLVYAGDLLHFHFDEMTDISLDVEQAMGIARDLLSEDARLNQWYASGMVYRATVEFCYGGDWTVALSTSLILWNYFGKRNKRVLVNCQLPKRLSIEAEKT